MITFPSRLSFVRTLRILLAVFLWLSLAAEHAEAQARTALPDSLFDASSNAELRRVIEEARASGLPTAPLVSRALQGGARHVSGPRVVALVRAHADSMRAARFALGTLSNSDELDAGATALRAGASRLALRRVRMTRAPGEATTALVVLADLLTRGIRIADASDALVDLAEHAPDSTLLSLQAAVAREGETATPQRLRALVNEFARTLPPAPPGRVAIPPHRKPGTDPVPEVMEETNDSLPTPARRVDRVARDKTTQQSTPWFDEAGRGASLAIGTAISGTRAAAGEPDALLGRARYMRSLGAGLEVTPEVAMRLGDGSSRWTGALTLARQLQLAPSLTGRLFAFGEVHSGIATSRSGVAINPRLDAQMAERGRSAHASLRLGSEVVRRIGSTMVGAMFSLGQEQYSRMEQTLVPVVYRGVDSSVSPHDTVVPSVRYEMHSLWRAVESRSLRSGLSLRRGGWTLQGSYAQRLQAVTQRDDSSRAAPRALWSLGAERRVAPWAIAVAQWSSRDPAQILGAPSLHEARLSLGVRLTETVHAPRRAEARRSEARVSARPSVMSISVTAASAESLDSSRSVSSSGRDERVRVVVVAPHAASVDIEGDITAWQPKSLARVDATTFAGAFDAPSGVVRVRVRVNAGGWGVPPGVPSQLDDFGDAVGVIVVRRR